MSVFNYQPSEETFYIPDEMSSIVTSIQGIDEDEDDYGQPYFRWGYWKEIVDILDELSRHASSTIAKFPMVYLSLLYKAKKLNNKVTNFIDFDLFIIAESERDYSSTERLTTIFKGIIEPIYDDLITAILDNKWFRNSERIIEHEETNIFKAGAEDTNQNKLNQIIDAKHLSFINTEITNLKNY